MGLVLFLSLGEPLVFVKWLENFTVILCRKCQPVSYGITNLVSAGLFIRENLGNPLVSFTLEQARLLAFEKPRGEGEWRSCWFFFHFILFSLWYFTPTIICIWCPKLWLFVVQSFCWVNLWFSAWIRETFQGSVSYRDFPSSVFQILFLPLTFREKLCFKFLSSRTL